MTTPPTPEIEIYADAAALAEAAAHRLCDLTRARDGDFSLALAGGATPERLYRRLAQEPYLTAINWPRLHIFWSDERCVPPQHPASNFRLAHETLLRYVSIPPAHLHRIAGELAPRQAAEQYAAELNAFSAQHGQPLFDLLLLGLGADGHTASLFPGSPALEERTQLAVAVEHSTPPPNVPRVTLTLPALNSAAQVFFLVSGAPKAARLAQILFPSVNTPLLPAQSICPPQGRVVWLLDAAAAAHLPQAVTAPGNIGPHLKKKFEP